MKTNYKKKVKKIAIEDEIEKIMDEKSMQIEKKIDELLSKKIGEGNNKLILLGSDIFELYKKRTLIAGIIILVVFVLMFLKR